MQSLSSLSDLFSVYDGFLIDLWGVVHDGERLYPGVKELLMTLREEKKEIIFLSNAPRRAHKAASVLAGLGIGETLYDHVITSGEVLYGHLSETRHKGGNYYYIGPDKDLDILDGLRSYTRAGLAHAEFLLNVGFYYDHQPLPELHTMLLTAASLEKPMLCANPDRIVVRQNGEVLPCAGQIADCYVKMGGNVTWFGKPHSQVYERCFQRFSAAKKKVLAIGDALETDIAGAAAQHLDTLLITGGVLKEKLHGAGTEGLNKKTLEELCDKYKVTPTYVLPNLAYQKTEAAKLTG